MVLNRVPSTDSGHSLSQRRSSSVSHITLPPTSPRALRRLALHEIPVEPVLLRANAEFLNEEEFRARNFFGRVVQWVNVPRQGSSRLAVCCAVGFIHVLCVFSLVGVPVLILFHRELARQEERHIGPFGSNEVERLHQALYAQIATQQGEIETLNAEIAQLKEDQHRMRDELSYARSCSARFEVLSIDLQTIVDNKQREVDRLQAEVLRLKDVFAELQDVGVAQFS